MTTLAVAAPRATAGALRLVEASTATPTTVDVGAYLREMSAHCPYLEPSLHRGLTNWTVYRAVGETDAVEAELFHAGAQAAEWLRPLLSRAHGFLRCENVVVMGAEPTVRHHDVLTWPHWVLKNIYGPVGVMFGKFHEGAEEASRSGQPISVAPVSFLAVRAAVRRRDPGFLDATPGLADALAGARDDGRNLFEHIPQQWSEIRRWAKCFPLPKKPSLSSLNGSESLSPPGS
ncbi:DUF6875 domain-containing protein [Streptomyces chumphonensis]|uniref:DUF6875 domain-containing protein n=1 Tax=Streptomyces chumphonensis TaxID=1214925 RepID=UPI003D762A11